MRFNEMIKLQKVLDNKILNERELSGDETIIDRFLALFVELGELANEWRGFKFWSNDPNPRRPRMLDEFVDVMHFLVSIGNHFNFIENDKDYEFTPMAEALSVTEQFNHMYWLLSDLASSPRKDVYEELVVRFVVLGEMLDFHEKQIVDAYRKKNEINHVRQQENY
jgi:dimeric dUTPase (all-alpha-NTP-PPase superfamily)